MNKDLKIVLAILGIIGAGLLFIYGSVLPVLKSQAYINAAQSLPSVRTVQEFENNFDKVFNFYSPVGGEESAKYLMGNILSVVSAQKDQPEEVTRELIRYVEEKTYPDTRHYLSMANLYTMELMRSSQEADYEAAVNYYLKARANGPKLPPVLYGLLTLYQAKGDVAGIQEVGGAILKLWPQDARVSELLAGFELEQVLKKAAEKK
ncbi:MAG: hypothetical protein Q7S36_03090 [Candidatus Liptonbacteria bacterium]|nr:hypothetical protein [Candidatus Liptonbacteria bacterium]